MVAVLCLVLGIALIRSLVRGLEESKEALQKSHPHDDTVDLTVKLSTPSPHGINEAINDVLSQVARPIRAAQHELAALNLEKIDGAVAMPGELFAVELEQLNLSYALLRDARERVHPVYEQTQKLLRQIRGDLVLSSHMITSLSASLKDGGEVPKKINDVKEMVYQCVQSLKEITDNFDPILKHCAQTLHV